MAWPYFEQDEIDAVVEVLRSGKVNQWTGEQVRCFEKEFAAAMGTRHGVAVANGTLALELALWVLGVGPGDEVITTPRTFLASASAIVMRGATPVFAEVDSDSQNITAETIAKVLTPKTKAVIPVHLAGWPCEMDKIMALADQYGFFVIEDCAQAHGAKYQGQPVGSWGHMAAFSFCQDKIMTTGGEGGMLLTQDEGLWKKAWSYKDHGKGYDTVFHQSHPQGFRWLHEEFGTNWRMTEMQAAIGRKQLEKLPAWLAIRQANWRAYQSALSQLPLLRVPETLPESEHACYKFYCFVRPEHLKPGWTRDRILGELSQLGLQSFSGSCSEVYKEACFEKHDLAPQTAFSVAKQLGETSLMFMVDPSLTKSVIQDTIAGVTAVCKEATVEAALQKEPAL